MTFVLLSFCLLAAVAYPGMASSSSAENFFNDGVNLYQTGRYAEAMAAFDKAIRRHDRAEESQHYLDKIRKETVERIRNRMLTGISKTDWKNEFYFMAVIDDRLVVGLSDQALFDRRSVSFRPGAVDALAELSKTLRDRGAVDVDVELISELQDAPNDANLLARQQNAVFSYLALTSNGTLK